MKTPDRKREEELVKRSKIQELFNNKVKKSEIAKIVAVSRSTVDRWINRQSILREKSSGRPSKITLSDKKKVEEIMRDKVGVGTRRVAKCLNAEFEAAGSPKTLSRSSILRYVRNTDWGSIVRRVHNKPFLSQKNICDRIKFCDLVDSQGYLTNSRLGEELRSHILWTDESLIHLHPKINSNNAVIRTSDVDSIPINQVPKHSLSIMVAGGICSRGKSSLVIVPGSLKVNTSLYNNLIMPVYLEAMKNKELFSCPRKILFQQDMAPAHSSKVTSKFLKESDLETWSKGQWPGNSPDLNVIEHIWHQLQESVLVEPRPTTREELIQRVQEKWDSIGVDELKKLVESFPNRIKECRLGNGKHTQY